MLFKLHLVKGDDTPMFVKDHKASGRRSLVNRSHKTRHEILKNKEEKENNEKILYFPIKMKSHERRNTGDMRGKFDKGRPVRVLKD